MDHASETLIRAALLEARPHDGFVGEESVGFDGTSGVQWVVDPIDGTVNYLYGFPAFAVSIAARWHGDVVAGVVLNPASEETWTASIGRGARLDGAPIQVSAVSELRLALVATGFGYDARQRAVQAELVARLLPNVRDIRRMGAASLDLCAVACGRVDAYYEQGLKPWDLAAAGLVAVEAGARVEGANGAPAGEQLVIAAPPGLFGQLHDEVVGLASSALDEQPTVSRD
jgi:myo-inositol-1(or 4)-monophosphatase